jgi:hypothetical protein
MQVISAQSSGYSPGEYYQRARGWVDRYIDISKYIYQQLWAMEDDH